MPDPVYRALAPRRSLPTLEDTGVAAPCFVPWHVMAGDERVRSCPQCAKQVFEISGMSPADAEVLLRERVEGACARFYRRLDGTILTTDCPVGIRNGRVHWVAKTWFVTVAAAIVAGVGIRVWHDLRSPSTRTGSLPDAVGKGDNRSLRPLARPTPPFRL